jgi:ABC-type transport system involved in multi-copper enzyme maturation permease subunit
MLLRVWTVAMNTYRECVRQRILLGLAGVAFAVSVFSLVIGSFTLTNASRVVSDLGAASISLFGIAVSVVIGATSLYRELEQKTIFPILARPIARGEYLVGKYVGTLVTIAVFVAADSGLVLSLGAILGGRDAFVVGGVGLALVVVLGIAAYRSPVARTYGLVPWSLALLAVGIYFSSVVPDERRMVLTSSYLTLLEVVIVTGFATLLSSFSSPFLSALLTIGIWLVGRGADSLARFPVKFFGPAIANGAKVLGKIVPNLQIYVPPRPLLTGEAIDVDRVRYLFLATGTSLAWAVSLLSLGIIVFKRRDFL